MITNYPYLPARIAHLHPGLANVDGDDFPHDDVSDDLSDDLSDVLSDDLSDDLSVLRCSNDNLRQVRLGNMPVVSTNNLFLLKFTYL